MNIDSHQHFWKISRGDYGWLTPDLSMLYQDYLPTDLEPILRSAGIHGTILVQAAPTLAETHFLLQLAEKHDFIKGVVGWVDLGDSSAAELIHHLATQPRFCGLRPMLQDISDLNFMLKKEFLANLEILAKLNLTFDALVLPKHLPNLRRVVEKLPHLTVVIDHGAKPQIREGLFEPWAAQMRELAQYPQVYCKWSGLLNLAVPNATGEDLRPYVDHLFECFGYNRLLWGSDYPVLNAVSSYPAWLALCQNYMERLGEEARTAIFGKTAAQVYLRRFAAPHPL